MLYRVFRGKNWKLAGEKKWLPEKVSTLLGKVGHVKFGDEDFDVHEVDDGFAAVPQIEKEYVRPDIQYSINAGGGNWNVGVKAQDDEEAKSQLIKFCDIRNTVGTLYRVDNRDGSVVRIAGYNARKST